MNRTNKQIFASPRIHLLTLIYTKIKKKRFKSFQEDEGEEEKDKRKNQSSNLHYSESLEENFGNVILHHTYFIQ